mgnify:CR=1 FL=1|tara:strand:+ start:382 stop:1062 length:681 start_codon:yes stop_codon:yes gene_type:complete
MCTVTYLPLGNNNFILTSNRDETPSRKTTPPKLYEEDGVQLTYPKDELAGGTWIGTSNKKRLVCLLNGGFESYEREASYKMSRGIIVKAILKSNNCENYIHDFDFIGIEPFTIVLVDWNTDLKTYELVWDGKQKHFTALKQVPRIWSSSTLYSQKDKALRIGWFDNWLENNQEFNQEEILKFHHNSEIGTPENSLKMKRWYVETVSITSVEKMNKAVVFNYEKITQ